jgi:hypothetical protein
MTKLQEMINSQLYDGAGDPQDVEEFADHLSEGFIDPLADLGFDLLEYSYAHLEAHEGGVHVLEFDYFNDNNISQASLKRVDEICTQDDDSQPAANYRLWLGTLWLFIPYKA